MAGLDPAIVGGFGPNLHRTVLQLHFQGQMTCERIVALLNDIGLMISKRQVVRLLTTKLAAFRAEDAEVLKVGLMGDYVSVDGPEGTGEAGARVTPARAATPRRSARTAFACSAPGRRVRAHGNVPQLRRPRPYARDRGRRSPPQLGDAPTAR